MSHPAGQQGLVANPKLVTAPQRAWCQWGNMTEDSWQRGLRGPICARSPARSLPLSPPDPPPCLSLSLFSSFSFSVSTFFFSHCILRTLSLSHGLFRFSFFINTDYCSLPPPLPSPKLESHICHVFSPEGAIEGTHIKQSRNPIEALILLRIVIPCSSSQ